MRKKKALILCDHGKVGTYKQCLFVARLLDPFYEFKEEHVSSSALTSLFPPFLFYAASSLYGCIQKGPHPSLVIAGGRRAIAHSLLHRKHSFIIALQNPRLPLDWFDAVIAPAHDELTRHPHLFETMGPLTLPFEQDFDKTFNEFAHLHAYNPFVSVLIGGNSKHYTYTAKDAVKLADYLNKEVSRTYALLITGSRRTPPFFKEVLSSSLKERVHWIWDQQGPNPYGYLLEKSQAIIVTSDSMSMMAEACLFKKPVFIYELKLSSRRLCLFPKDLLEKGHAFKAQTSPISFKERILNYRPPPLLNKEGDILTFLKTRGAFF